jgi:hypothetical protein
MADAPTRYVIMMDEDVANSESDWPVVFVRDSVAELEALDEYSRVWRYLPRGDYEVHATPRKKSLRYTPDSQRYPGRIYTFRYKGTA